MKKCFTGWIGFTGEKQDDAMMRRLICGLRHARVGSRIRSVAVHLWREGKRLSKAFVIASFTRGWRNAQRYWYALFSHCSAYWALRVASSRASEAFPSDFFFNFLEDLQAIVCHELRCLLRKVIDLFGADPEESLPTELVEALQPRLFPIKKFDPCIILPSQKLIQ